MNPRRTAQTADADHRKRYQPAAAHLDRRLIAEHARQRSQETEERQRRCRRQHRAGRRRSPMPRRPETRRPSRARHSSPAYECNRRSHTPSPIDCGIRAENRKAHDRTWEEATDASDPVPPTRREATQARRSRLQPGRPHASRQARRQCRRRRTTAPPRCRCSRRGPRPRATPAWHRPCRRGA